MNLIDLKRLSEHTSLSIYTHRKYIKMGMPHYRVGRKILVDPQEVKLWFQQFKSGVTQVGKGVDRIVDEAIEKYR